MISPIARFKSAYNAFMGRAPTSKTYYYGGTSYRPDRTRHRIQNERSFVNSIYNRLSVDGSSIDIKHVQLDKTGNYKNTIDDFLNMVLSSDANMDQTGRAMINDLIYSILDEGCVALFPSVTTVDPYKTDSYEVCEVRVAKIIEWYPYQVKIEAYDETTGQKKQVVIDKRLVPIIENPFYAIMNEPNSTLQRLIRTLNQLDRLNEDSTSGKMDLIVQLPYPIKNEAKLKIAEQRRKDIETQLTESRYGVAYIDGTEKVIQLNRPIENNLWEQVKDLKTELLNQMGITMEILNGTADPKTMTNYYNRIVEPILTAIIEEIDRKWISKNSKTRGHGIRFFRDPFKLIPVTELAEIADKFTRNEIMTSNEIRVRIGLPPSDDPKADKLINSNLNQPEENATEVETKIVEHSQDIFHYGMPRRSGRYPYGSGDRPFQSNEIGKSKNPDGSNSYTIKDSNGSILSEVKIYNFDIKNFDWSLMADVVTQKDYRGKGMATKLINMAYDDLRSNSNNGLYLFVAKDNINAIKLYEQLNFEHVKTYSLEDGDYFIMAKGNDKIDQLKSMNFT